VLNSWFCPSVSTIVNKCGGDGSAGTKACQQQAREFASQARVELDTEGFVTLTTLTKYAPSDSLGILPALLASMRAMGAEVLHMEDAPPETSLACLKFYLHDKLRSDYIAIYCGNLDESNELQRTALRTFLKPLQPLGVVLRASNYLLHPEVRPAMDLISLAHFKAMLLTLSSVIVQDDSGIPFPVLAKHSSDLSLWGEYRGLGDPELSGLNKVPGSVIKALYQPELASLISKGPLPFKFGYRKVIGPSGKKTTEVLPLTVGAGDAASNGEVFVKRSDSKAAILS
jgi:hypothetical protein